jgi:hypothetical protein
MNQFLVRNIRKDVLFLSNELLSQGTGSLQAWKGEFDLRSGFSAVARIDAAGGAGLPAFRIVKIQAKLL